MEVASSVQIVDSERVTDDKEVGVCRVTKNHSDIFHNSIDPKQTVLFYRNVLDVDSSESTIVHDFVNSQGVTFSVSVRSLQNLFEDLTEVGTERVCWKCSSVTDSGYNVYSVPFNGTVSTPETVCEDCLHGICIVLRMYLEEHLDELTARLV